MNKDRATAASLVQELVAWSGAIPNGVEVVIAPPFPFLAQVVQQVRDTPIIVAAQNCHEAANGAFTGEVSVDMLASIGVRACIVGHSERRQYFGETDAAVGRKMVALLGAGLTPIYCCGEVEEERRSERHFEVVRRQIREAFNGMAPHRVARVVIAYEPVWAIGTGLTASPQQAQEMHAFIRAEMHSLVGDVADTLSLLYGGSCKPDNAAGLFGQPDINGGLIGGAALDVAPFTELIRIAGQVPA